MFGFLASRKKQILLGHGIVALIATAIFSAYFGVLKYPDQQGIFISLVCLTGLSGLLFYASLGVAGLVIMAAGIGSFLLAAASRNSALFALIPLAHPMFIGYLITAKLELHNFLELDADGHTKAILLGLMITLLILLIGSTSLMLWQFFVKSLVPDIWLLDFPFAVTAIMVVLGRYVFGQHYFGNQPHLLLTLAGAASSIVTAYIIVSALVSLGRFDGDDWGWLIILIPLGLGFLILYAVVLAASCTVIYLSLFPPGRWRKQIAISA